MTDSGTSFARNEKRTGSDKIKPIAIFAKQKALEIPELSAGYDELYEVKNEGISLL